MSWTIKQAVEWAYEQLDQSPVFYGHGTDNAWDEAVWIVLFVLGRSADAPINDASRHLREDQQSRLKSLVKQRIKSRIPTAYLVKSAWFCGMEFYVDERVIIPRSPIAELIVDQFSEFKNPKKIKRVLDLCTGSGCIALAIAKNLPQALVDASDYSKEALEVAKINRKKHGLEKRVQLFHSDVFRSIPTQKYDLIVSNPPYVDQHDFDTMPEEYQHEPEMALISGQDGLFVTNQIIQQSRQFLSDDGVLIVEVGNSEKHVKKRWPGLAMRWLEFYNGGAGVFAIKAQDLSKS